MITTVPLAGWVVVIVPLVGISLSLFKMLMLTGVFISVEAKSSSVSKIGFTVIVTVAVSQLGVGVALSQIV